MGFRFRKSKKLGPFRFTVSKSGVSASVGIPGFRVTKTASGNVRTTVSIPGTGINYVNETNKKGKTEDLAKKHQTQAILSSCAAQEKEYPEPTLENAARFAYEKGNVSISDLQLHFGLGYTNAAKLIDQMYSAGIVGPFNGRNPREVLITEEYFQN